MCSCWYQLCFSGETWKKENITTDVLVKICIALKCDISDIMEIIEIEGEKV